MIGNDIVDLKTAASHSNWQRPGFLNKLFHSSEQQFILESPEPHVQVWIFWAMKEAAYKAHQRRFRLSRRFNPKSFVCNLNYIDLGGASGNVQIEHHNYIAQIEIFHDHLHCIATSLQQQVFSQILPSSSNIKQTVCDKIGQQLLPVSYGVSIDYDENGVPHLRENDNFLEHPFSLSNHGKYAAYCFALRNY